MSEVSPFPDVLCERVGTIIRASGRIEEGEKHF